MMASMSEPGVAHVATMTEPSPIVMHSDNISQTALDSFSDVSSGNVVWQTLLSNLNNSTNTNSLCAGIAFCPSNGSLALHQHKQAEMYYILSGTGQVEINGVRHDVREGSILWIPGDIEHGVFCGEEETLKWLYVFPEGRFEDVKYQFKLR